MGSQRQFAGIRSGISVRLVALSNPSQFGCNSRIALPLFQSWQQVYPRPRHQLQGGAGDSRLNRLEVDLAKRTAPSNRPSSCKAAAVNAISQALGSSFFSHQCRKAAAGTWPEPHGWRRTGPQLSSDRIAIQNSGHFIAQNNIDPNSVARPSKRNYSTTGMLADVENETQMVRMLEH